MTVKMRQEINFLNRPFNSTGSLVLSDEIAYFDTADYNGEAVYLEVFAKNLSGGSLVVFLESDTTADFGTPEIEQSVSIPGNTDYWTLIRSAQVTGIGGPYFKVAHPAVNGTDVEVKLAKLIILQSATDITETQTQIEVGNYQSEILAAAANTWYVIDFPKWWKYESAKWDPAPTITFGITYLCENDMGSIDFGIQEDDGAGGWTTTPIATITGLTSETVDYQESASFTPTNGKIHRLVWRSSNTMYGMDIYNAKMILTQTDATAITKLQPEYLLINEAVLFDEFQMESPIYFDPGEWEGVNNAYYHEHGGSHSGDYSLLVELSDKYSLNNYTADLLLYSGSKILVSQSFTGDGKNLGSVKFLLAKTGPSMSGNVTAYLYAHTGTFGTSSEPTGSALATSEPLSIDEMTGTIKGHGFVFTGGYTLVNGTKYCIVIGYSGGDASNALKLGIDSSGSHEGNMASYISSWTTSSGDDVVFELYTQIDGSDMIGEDLLRSAGEECLNIGEGTYSRLYGGSGTYEELGQSFQIDNSRTINQIALPLSKTGSPTDNIYLRVTSSIGGTILETSSVKSAAIISSTLLWHVFEFTGVSLSASTTYYLELYRSGSRDTSNHIDWEYNTEAYTDGTLYDKNSGSWGYDASYDRGFRIFYGCRQPQKKLIPMY
jgi:hypothetical protein